MQVKWTSQAQRHRYQILNYIAADNPTAAIKMSDLFNQAAAHLVDFPNRGRIGEVVGTRELLPHENYRLIYEIDDETVWILALVHAARQWPPESD